MEAPFMARTSLRVLLVDGDVGFLEAASKTYAAVNQTLIAAHSQEQALAYLDHGTFDVVVVGSRLSDGVGHDVLRRSADARVETARLFLSEETSIDAIAEAFRAGACDYLVKPISPQELERRCRKAYEERQKNRQTLTSTAAGGSRAFVEMVGASPAITKLRRLIERFGPSDQAILIEGESGTGKELVARALLRANHRANAPFITVNCAALPEPLLESEFFGHERGAFTGATGAKMGLFEAADGGTLFVDEIGELAPSLQAKLLRVLEDGSFRRVGSVKERKVDVRLIAATNRDLAAAVASGRFREDLYFRINVMSLHVPPLRARDGDIARLIEWFLGGAWMLDERAEYALLNYRWPGNVRQLKNSLERAKVLADGKIIRLCDLPPEIAIVGEAAANFRFAEPDDIETLEREHVLTVLARMGGNKSHAARALGIHRRTLYRMLERWSTDEPAVAILPVV
jgi:DNA-binding NtrC family response regulator